tara:strand:- start:455 stop:1111 length:657 start_codon:yes stop_codon:yes gene_type:complete
MFSANRGMVESISRVNTLRQLLFNIENDKAEQHDGNLNLGTFFGRRGPSNGTSHLLQIMGSNTSVGGTVDPTITASNTRRDLRIPLSDLFGVGSALWNSDVYGSTRIHLELDTSRLRIEQLGGSEDTTNFQPAGQNRTYGAMLDNTAASAALGGPPQLPDGMILALMPHLLRQYLMMILNYKCHSMWVRLLKLHLQIQMEPKPDTPKLVVLNIIKVLI